jgi:hypothetical protein
MVLPFGNFSGQEVVDSDGFAPPPLGGSLAVKHNTVAYTNTTTKNLFKLPKGAVIVAWIVNVVTAFNSSGTDLLDIGDGSTANRFANDIDVSSAGQKLTGYVAAELYTPLTDETQITAIFVQSVADAAAGDLDVACLYYIQ